MIASLLNRGQRGIVAGLAMVALAGGTLWAQERALRPVRVFEKRALLIGNSDYSRTNRLVNTIPDVRALERALTALGFDVVTRHENLSLREMETSVRRFATGLDAGDLALFYYSGHGVQVDRENFLLPVDFELETQPAEVEYAALAVERVQDMMRATGARVRVLVLDACRNNPYGDSRSGTTGLAAMDADGDLIVYATGAGDVASDNQSGALGLYMTHLLPELERKTVELKEAFDRARVAVYEAARSRGESQRPAQYEDLIGKVYLRGGPSGPILDEPSRISFEPSPTPLAAPGQPAATPAPPEVSSSPPPSAKTVSERWDEIKETDRTDELETFVERYGDEAANAVWMKLASIRLENLKIERLLEKARAAWAAVQETRSAGALETFVEVYSSVPGAAELVQQAKEQLAGLGTAQVWTNGLGMEFVLVPAGGFEMGSTSGLAESDERPVTRVRISRAFYLGKHEVTQGEWAEVMKSQPSHFSDCGRDCPVESVSWEEAMEFVARLNAREVGERYRLPTEAEWEYAARAGMQADTFAGDLSIRKKHDAPALDRIAWYGGNSGVTYEKAESCSGWEGKQYAAGRCGTHPVGKKAPNRYGLHDMLGNVNEWVQDWYGAYPGGSLTDPTGPTTGAKRVGRGGNWRIPARNCRSAERFPHRASARNRHTGLRLVREAK